MSGALAALGGLGALARAWQATADVVGLVFKRKADADQRSAGATAAEDETMIDTAEISDAQAANTLLRRTPGDIARQLRREADEADGGGDGAKPG